MYNYIHTALCADYQDGQYRVQNGTVLQECVDQQWTTVENTSQLLTMVQQDNDKLINETLNTQCSTTSTNNEMTTSYSIKTTEQQDIGSYIAIIALLVVALLATAAGWMITCVVVRKKSQHKKLT